jgi:hypothetical protein
MEQIISCKDDIAQQYLFQVKLHGIILQRGLIARKQIKVFGMRKGGQYVWWTIGALCSTG